ncbi:hypothetical protein swp_1076 [Shewanella piezotolerans WP3]|uniref:Uncharacterized protein n=1 Tax=Shewanella piezotolerans (strain WP3 / JCM 13877) TaxID=225849 RepID=B8CJB4_SHEPW|nr:hypothetical protein swp_1076 [Shewanella piezotolerans WP3]
MVANNMRCRNLVSAKTQKANLSARFSNNQVRLT